MTAREAAPGQAALLAVVDGHFFTDGPNPLQLVCMTEDDNDVECDTWVAEVGAGTTWNELEHRMAEHARASHYAAAVAVQQRQEAAVTAAAAAQGAPCAYCEDDPDHPDPDNPVTCSCLSPGCGRGWCPQRDDEAEAQPAPGFAEWMAEKYPDGRQFNRIDMCAAYMAGAFAALMANDDEQPAPVAAPGDEDDFPIVRTGKPEVWVAAPPADRITTGNRAFTAPAQPAPGALAEKDPVPAFPGQLLTCYCGITATVVLGAFPHADCDGSVAAKPAPGPTAPLGTAWRLLNETREKLATLSELLDEVGVLAANAPEDGDCFAVCEEITMRIAAAGIPGAS